MASLAASRSAKRKAIELLHGDPNVNGVGIVRHGSGYVLRINLRSGRPALGPNFPDEIDGVPVQIEVVGEIRSLGD